MKKSFINRFRVSSYSLRRYAIIFVLTCLLIAVLMSPSDKKVNLSESPTIEGEKNTGHTPVIIFKLPRTGSSWFTQELNRCSSKFISTCIFGSILYCGFNSDNLCENDPDYQLCPCKAFIYMHIHS